jgi:hypothetical protein
MKTYFKEDGSVVIDKKAVKLLHAVFRVLDQAYDLQIASIEIVAVVTRGGVDMYDNIRISTNDLTCGAMCNTMVQIDPMWSPPRG